MKKCLIIVGFLVLLCSGFLLLSNKNTAMAQGQGQNQGNIFLSHYQKQTFILNSAADTTIALPVSNEPILVMIGLSDVSGTGGKRLSSGLIVHDTFIYDSIANATHGTANACCDPRSTLDRADWSTSGTLLFSLNASSANTITLSFAGTSDITHATVTVTMFH